MYIMAAMTKEQLAKRISDLALLRGEFILRSGRKSNYYLDKYRFETDPQVLKELGKKGEPAKKPLPPRQKR